MAGLWHCYTHIISTYEIYSNHQLGDVQGTWVNIYMDVWRFTLLYHFCWFGTPVAFKPWLCRKDPVPSRCASKCLKHHCDFDGFESQNGHRRWYSLSYKLVYKYIDISTINHSYWSYKSTQLTMSETYWKSDGLENGGFRQNFSKSHHISTYRTGPSLMWMLVYKPLSPPWKLQLDSP